MSAPKIISTSYLRFHRGFQSNERFGRGRIELAFSVASQRSAALLRLRELHELRGLAVNFASLAVDDVQARAVMAHAGANLPGDQRILIGDVVADQQNASARCKHLPSWPVSLAYFGPSAAARPA